MGYQAQYSFLGVKYVHSIDNRKSESSISSNIVESWVEIFFLRDLVQLVVFFIVIPNPELVLLLLWQENLVSTYSIII